MLMNILFVWLPLIITAGVAWAALRNIKAVLIITAIAGAGLWFFSSSPTPPAVIPPPPVIAHDPPPPPPPLPRPPPPIAPVVQPMKPPPCVAPPRKGNTYYFCDENNRLHFVVPIPGTVAGDKFLRDWALTHPNE